MRGVEYMNSTFEWIKYYSKLSNKLLKYKSNRADLIDLLKESFN